MRYRKLTARMKARALEEYHKTPNVQQVAERLRLDPLKLSTYFATDDLAIKHTEVALDTRLGSQQDLLLDTMAAAQRMRYDLINNVNEAQRSGGQADFDEVKNALTAAKQTQDLYTWTTEQLNTRTREDAIIAAFEAQQAQAAIAPIAQPLDVPAEFTEKGELKHGKH